MNMPLVRLLLIATAALLVLVLPGGTVAPVMAAGQTTVTIDGVSRVVDGINVYRKTNFLVLYDPDHGASTGTNQYGFEAQVIDGKVTKIENGVGNLTIPVNGYVLSGHGTSRTWLKTRAQVGDTVQVNDTGGGR